MTGPHWVLQLLERAWRRLRGGADTSIWYEQNKIHPIFAGPLISS